MAKSPKTFRPVVAVANDLRSGAVVFRTPDGTWSPEIGRAEIAPTRDAADALQAHALADQAACRVVEPTLIDVVQEGAFVRPAALRELIRATGPTVSVFPVLNTIDA